MCNLGTRAQIGPDNAKYTGKSAFVFNLFAGLQVTSQMAGIFIIIGSIPERTGPNDCNVGDDLNLHGAARGQADRRLGVSCQLDAEQPNFRFAQNYRSIRFNQSFQRKRFIIKWISR